MKVTVIAQVDYAKLIDAFCLAAPLVDATDYTGFDLTRIGKAIGILTAKLADHENKKALQLLAPPQ
jgi:hypothetical protein